MKIVGSVNRTRGCCFLRPPSRVLARSRAPVLDSSIFRHSVTEFGLFYSSCSSYLPRIAAEGPALAGSVAEQDRQRRGAPGTDEASRAQPQLQPNFVHRPR